MGKMRIVSINEAITPDFSVTARNKKDIFNVFRETDGKDFGDFHKSRLLSLGWTKEQLEYVKKHGTTNFVRSK